VTTYVDRPLNTEQVALQLETLRGSRNRLEHAVRAAVGTTGMKDVQRMVRFTMCAEALDRVRGSRRAAARLLGVDRRAIQKLIEQMQDSEMSGAGE
jgi:DNA-binding NtrC family response regulator